MAYVVNTLTRSLNVFHVAGSACNNCDIEILDALTPKYDLERFGITLVGSIRHADVLLVSGVFNRKATIRAKELLELSLIHISEPTRRRDSSRMPSSA